MRFAEPKPNEPLGDLLLSSIRHALAFVNELAHRTRSASSPRPDTSRWPERMVLAVRRGHVDDVDVRVGNQRVVRTVDAVDAMGVAEPTRPVARAGPHSGDTLVGVGQDGRDEVAGDGPRCEHAPQKDGTAALRRLCDIREPAG
jgi:hypothetical protein